MRAQIFILLLINALSAVGYSLLAPLYPQIAQEKGISEAAIGIIFSSFAVANVIAIPMTPTLLKKIGRKKLFTMSMIIEAFCTLIFGFLSNIPGKNLFIFFSLATRFSQGIGSALSATLVYSCAASLSSNSSIKVNLGYMELAYSIGLTVGPFIASIFYHVGGYSFPFFICGCLIITLCSAMIQLLQINDQTQEESSVFAILFHLEIFTTFLSLIVDMIGTTYIYPVFSMHLMNKFQLSVEISSLFFALQMLAYFIALQLLNKIGEILNTKTQIAVGLTINALMLPFLSPALFLPQYILVVIFGLMILGVSGALIMVPAMINIMDTIKRKMGINDDSANDYSSALYNLAVNVGEAIGPIMGGYVTKKQGFESACYYGALLNAFYCLLFVICQRKLSQRQLFEDDKKSNGNRTKEMILLQDVIFKL